MPPCFASTRRRRFKHSTGWTRCCRSYGAAPHGTALISCGPPQGAVSLHADLFVLAQSGGVVVRQDPAGRDCARRVHFGGESGQEAAEIHPRLLEISTVIPLDLH